MQLVVVSALLKNIVSTEKWLTATVNKETLYSEKTVS